MINVFLSDSYAWGGSATGRDCSMMVRDYFAVLGKGFSSNSLAQCQDLSAQVVALKHLARSEKKAKHSCKSYSFSHSALLSRAYCFVCGVYDVSDPLLCV